MKRRSKTKMVQTRFLSLLHEEPVQGSLRQGSDTRWWGLTQGVWRPVQYSDEVDVDVKAQVEFESWVEDDNVWIEEYFDLVGGEAAAREVQGVFWKKLRSFCCTLIQKVLRMATTQMCEAVCEKLIRNCWEVVASQGEMLETYSWDQDLVKSSPHT